MLFFVDCYALHSVLKLAKGLLPVSYTHLCDGMENLLSKDLLPSDKAFDIGFHILLFKKGGSHSFVETHHQEHGAFVLQGEGMYLLDSMWGPVKEGDFIWMGPFVPQAAYASCNFCKGRSVRITIHELLKWCTQLFKCG